MKNPNPSASRRSFLRTAAAGAACLATNGPLVTRMSAQSPESRVDILLNEPMGTIAPEIYGHFVENLGGVVYDGIWVGENSSHSQHRWPAQATGGSAAARQARPMIRWPGGCFADSYDWRDGIGPRARASQAHQLLGWRRRVAARARAATVRRATIPNQFGTVEFARFCKLIGAQPYFAANLRGSDRTGVRSLGGVLQFARGFHHAGRAARGRRRDEIR